jgi:hypothetical protein
MSKRRGFDDGTFRKRADGFWEARFYDENGEVCMQKLAKRQEIN